MANFINWESGSTICMNFIWIGSHALENQTRLLLLFESGTFAQNMVPRPTSYSAVTMAMIHLPIQIWLFLSIPQGNLPTHKIEEGLKFFISNFASLSWRIALKNSEHFNVWRDFLLNPYSFYGWPSLFRKKKMLIHLQVISFLFPILVEKFSYSST